MEDAGKTKASASSVVCSFHAKFKGFIWNTICNSYGAHCVHLMYRTRRHERA